MQKGKEAGCRPRTLRSPLHSGEANNGVTLSASLSPSGQVTPPKQPSFARQPGPFSGFSMLPLVAMEAASENLACQQSRLLCHRLSQSTFPVRSGQHTPRECRLGMEEAAVMPDREHSSRCFPKLQPFQNPPPRSSLTYLFPSDESLSEHSLTFLALLCLCLPAMLPVVDLCGCTLRASNAFCAE